MLPWEEDVYSVLIARYDFFKPDEIVAQLRTRRQKRERTWLIWVRDPFLLLRRRVPARNDVLRVLERFRKLGWLDWRRRNSSPSKPWARQCRSLHSYSYRLNEKGRQHLDLYGGKGAEAYAPHIIEGVTL